jgi:RNA polymerase sigma factor (sigma-70 family)
MKLFDFFKKSKNDYSKSKSDNSDLDYKIAQSISIYFRNVTRKEIDSHFLKAKSSLLSKQKEEDLSIVKEVSVEYQKQKEDTGIRFRMITKAENIFNLPEPEKSKIIIEYLLNQDQVVFDYLYEIELPKIVKLVIRNHGSIQNAEDIFQDALMIIYEKICKNDLKIQSSFCGYLYSVAKNIWYKQLQNNNLNVVFIDDVQHDDMDTSFFVDESIPDNFELIAKVIDSLGESCKALLEYYYFKKMNWVDIAKNMGYSNAGSARNQKYKCVERIKNMLTKKLIHE